MDGFLITLYKDGRILYVSETVSVYLGLSQVGKLLTLELLNGELRKVMSGPLQNIDCCYLRLEAFRSMLKSCLGRAYRKPHLRLRACRRSQRALRSSQFELQRLQFRIAPICSHQNKT